MVFQKEFLEKVDFEKKSADNKKEHRKNAQTIAQLTIIQFFKLEAAATERSKVPSCFTHCLKGYLCFHFFIKGLR